MGMGMGNLILRIADERVTGKRKWWGTEKKPGTDYSENSCRPGVLQGVVVNSVLDNHPCRTCILGRIKNKKNKPLQLSGTKVIETKVIETKVIETKVIETKVIETKVIETFLLQIREILPHVYLKIFIRYVVKIMEKFSAKSFENYCKYER